MKKDLGGNKENYTKTELPHRKEKDKGKSQRKKRKKIKVGFKPRKALDCKQHEIAADLHYGKIKKNGQLGEIKAQKGLSCLLFCARRLYNGNCSDLGDSKEYAAYKILKKGFAEAANSPVEGLYTYLMQISIEACQKLNIILDQLLQESFVFDLHFYDFLRKEKLIGKQYNELKFEDIYKMYQSSSKLEMLNKILYCTYYTEAQKHILAKFGLVAGNEWNPQKGVEVLMDTIKQWRALLVGGTLGMSFYKGMPNKWDTTVFGPTVKYKDERSKEFYTFSEENYIARDYEESHAVVVDAVKQTPNRGYMVFFRDPCNSSRGKTPEQVYALQYENFCKHVDSFTPSRFGEAEECYAFHSKTPTILTKS